VAIGYPGLVDDAVQKEREKERKQNRAEQQALKMYGIFLFLGMFDRYRYRCKLQ